jgi:hypothetical protein
MSDDEQRVRSPGSGRPAELLRRGIKAKVARWVIQRRARLGARGGGPDTKDEATHEWDGRPHFAEDYTFGCVQSDLGLVLRLEWLPDRDAQRVWVVVLTPDGALALPGMATGGSHGLVSMKSANRWIAGGLELDCAAPHRQWTVRFRGSLQPSIGGGNAGESHVSPLDPSGERRCNIDLTFIATALPFVPGSDDDPDLVARNFGSASWDVGLVRRLRQQGNRSYVQLGEVHGTVGIGESIHTVRATCIRSHSWGIRDWGASDSGFQCLVVPNDDTCAWAHNVKFPWLTLEGGFVRRGDGLSPIQAMGLTAERQHGVGLPHVSLSLEHDGKRLPLEAERVSDLEIDVDGRGHVTFSLMRARHGHSEHAGWALWVWQRRLPTG